MEESTASVLVMQICGKTLYAVAPAQTLRCALLWRGVVPVARPSGPGQCPSLAFPPRSPRVAASRRVGSPWKRQTRKPVVAGAWVFQIDLFPWRMRGTQGQVTLKTVFLVSLYSFLYFVPLKQNTTVDFYITFTRDGWRTAYIQQAGPATDHWLWQTTWLVDKSEDLLKIPETF